MKKRLLTLVLALVAVLSLVQTAAAASYPSAFLDIDDWKKTYYTSSTSHKEIFHFTYFPAYKNEKLHVKILNPSGKVDGTADFNISNSYTTVKYYSVTWDTSNKTPGTYKIVLSYEFYSMYRWNEAPTQRTYSITVKSLSAKPSPKSCSHRWSTGDETAKATCTQNGVKEYFCYDCYTTKTEETPLHHTFNYSGTCTVCGVSKLSTPVMNTPSNNSTTGRIKLSWDFVSGASYYNVYRADSERGTYNLLAKGTKVSDTVFTDGTSGKAGNTYWYKVSAVDVNGAELSDKSGAVSRVSKCQRPTGLKAAANDDGSVTLTWDKPAIAGSVSGYRVYMWNDGAFEWIGGGLKTVGTTVTVPAQYITPGKATNYSVRGYNNKSVVDSMSAYSAVATVATASNIPGPVGLTADNNLTTGRVRLHWDALDGADSYNVYRADSQNGRYVLKGADVTATTYTDGASGRAGSTYWYKITANIDGVESDKSDAVSRVSKCQRPTGLEAVANDDGTVTLTWDAPLVAGSVSYYRVYMWNNGGFEWIGGSLKTADTTITIPAEYITPGKLTNYSVRGYNTKNVLETMSIYALPAAATVE